MKNKMWEEVRLNKMYIKSGFGDRLDNLKYYFINICLYIVLFLIYLTTKPDLPELPDGKEFDDYYNKIMGGDNT